MASNDAEVDSSTTELKYLGFVKEFAVKILVVLSNVYEYAKENSGGLKSTVVFLEDFTVAAMGPIYEKIEDVSEQILVFVDEKIDEYTPTFIKDLVAEIQSLIQKLTPSFEKLLTAAETQVAPLVTAAKNLVAPLVTAAKNLLQKALTTIKSLLQNLLNLLESLPIVGKIQSLLQKGLAAIQSKFQDSADTVESESIIDKAGSVLDDARDTAGNILGNIPIVGDTAKTALTNPADLVGSVLDDARDTAGNILGNIPIVGDTTKTALTNPADLVGQVIDKTSSIVEDTPILGDVSSAAQDIAKQAQIAGLKTAIKSAYAALKVVALPAIAQFWYKANTYPLFHALAGVILPVAELLAKWYNHVVTYMDEKGYTLFDFLPLVPIDEMRVAYKVVKAEMDGLSAVGDLAGVNDNNN